MGGNKENEVDKEWLELIKEAYECGLTVEEVQNFLNTKKRSKVLHLIV
ncbi:anti-repressor SinI family protein [Thalassobacillus sp. C254]|nr:anti-repressor SinI family protein [Thalassobacillus sp. C254]